MRSEVLRQELLKATELAGGSGNLAQTIAQLRCRSAPDVFKRDAAIAEKVDGVARKRAEATRLEDDADEVSHVGAIDDFVNASCADNESRRNSKFTPALGTVEQVVARQIENHLNAAGGQHAFALVCNQRRVGVPEATNARGEWRGGFALKVDHGFTGSL